MLLLYVTAPEAYRQSRNWPVTNGTHHLPEKAEAATIVELSAKDEASGELPNGRKPEVQNGYAADARVEHIKESNSQLNNIEDRLSQMRKSFKTIALNDEQKTAVDCSSADDERARSIGKPEQVENSIVKADNGVRVESNSLQLERVGNDRPNSTNESVK